MIAMRRFRRNDWSAKVKPSAGNDHAAAEKPNESHLQPAAQAKRVEQHCGNSRKGRAKRVNGG
jgi:hypothetical protein